MTALRRYLVTLATPRGEATIEVPSMLGPEAAGRRARMAGIALRWGAFDRVRVVSVEDITAP